MPEIIDHQISLYYFIEDKETNLDFKISDLEILGLPTRITHSLDQSNNREKYVWERKPVKISLDFLNHIQKLFNTSTRDLIIERYTLSPLALKSINGQQLIYNKETSDTARQQARLCLAFEKKSKERLKDQDIQDSHVFITLSEVEIYAFKTGFKVAVIHCEIHHTKILEVSLLTETVYKLSKLNTLFWKEADCHPMCETQTSMGKLMRNLVGNYKEYKKTRRVYIDTYLQIKQTLEQKTVKLSLLKLARHYTDDYQINYYQNDKVFIEDFSNVIHCIRPEGSATAVLIDEISPQFLKDFKNNVRKSVYTPMQLLIFHESNAIQSYLNQTTAWLEPTLSDKKMLSVLHHHQLAIQNFCLNFQQPIISKISMHNTIYTTLRETQYIDQQLNKAKLDNEIISEQISGFHQQKKQIRYCRLSKYGVSAVAFLTALTMSKEVFEVIIKYGEKAKTPSHFIEIIHQNAEIINLSIALLAMLIVFGVEQCHCKDDSIEQSHGSAKHLSEEHIKHHLLEDKS